MKIISAQNPTYTENGDIDLTVLFAEIGEPVPFTASMHDTEPHGRELYTRAMQGEFGPVAPCLAPVVPFHDLVAAKLESINNAKNAALDGGFLHDGVLFDSDSKARLAYLEFAFKLGQTPEYSTAWKASTGQWVTMNAELFTALQSSYEAHIQACFAWQAAREQELAAALALEDDAEARAALAAIPESM